MSTSRELLHDTEPKPTAAAPKPGRDSAIAGRVEAGRSHRDLIGRASRPRVLLIEVEPFQRYACGRLLRLQGFEVREAYDAEDAFSSIEEFRPDVILTDVGLPERPASTGGSGEVWVRPGGAAIPLISVTVFETKAAEGVRGRATRPPIDLPRLLDRIHTALRATG
ncbi:MAG: response regulator [Isosphaeraceae bacterium]|nr:response regulator [Isosphaeraceae bacterium]